jgi:hypothetical protein
MRRFLAGLTICGLLVLPGNAAAAPEAQDQCAEYSARAAMPSLMESYQYSPRGYGMLGFAPLTYPFGVGPYGNAVYFGGPGVPFGSAPAFGPLGPGLTANNIAAGIIGPSGMMLNQPQNFGTLIGLASLQQAELGNLNARYTLSSSYQEMASSWAAAYATQASATMAILRTLCEGLQPSSGSSSGSSPSPSPSHTVPTHQIRAH